MFVQSYFKCIQYRRHHCYQLLCLQLLLPHTVSNGVHEIFLLANLWLLKAPSNSCFRSFYSDSFLLMFGDFQNFLSTKSTYQQCLHSQTFCCQWEFRHHLNQDAFVAWANVSNDFCQICSALRLSRLSLFFINNEKFKQSPRKSLIC